MNVSVISLKFGRFLIFENRSSGSVHPGVTIDGNLTAVALSMMHTSECVSTGSVVTQL
jgi:hypothetical protein